jgi:hypothetical protein
MLDGEGERDGFHCTRLAGSEDVVNVSAPLTVVPEERVADALRSCPGEKSHKVIV